VKTTGAKGIIASKQKVWDAGEGAECIVIISRNSTYQVLGIHIKNNKPKSGMNAYTWKLLPAVVGLHLVTFMPIAIRGHSDCTCMRVIIRLNNAMLAFRDTQSGIISDVLITDGYELWAAEEDTKDKIVQRTLMKWPKASSLQTR
jgi:hypothetical protein